MDQYSTISQLFALRYWDSGLWSHETKETNSSSCEEEILLGCCLAQVIAAADNQRASPCITPYLGTLVHCTQLVIITVHGGCYMRIISKLPDQNEWQMWSAHSFIAWLRWSWPPRWGSWLSNILTLASAEITPSSGETRGGAEIQICFR